MSTIFPPDPTLTVENMNRVMAKVEPMKRRAVYLEILDYNVPTIQEEYSTVSGRDVANVDAYVNCKPVSSWKELAKVLYRLHHVAAVDDIKEYLPPRGESPFTCTCAV